MPPVQPKALVHPALRYSKPLRLMPFPEKVKCSPDTYGKHGQHLPIAVIMTKVKPINDFENGVHVIVLHDTFGVCWMRFATKCCWWAVSLPEICSAALALPGQCEVLHHFAWIV